MTDTEEESRLESVSERVAVTTTGSMRAVSWPRMGELATVDRRPTTMATPAGAAGKRRDTETSLEVMGP
jgi:hypothetical protein